MQTAASVKVARGATYLILQALTSNLLLVLFFALAARLLPTTADLGVVATLSMLSALFAIICSLAIPSALTKYVSEHIGKGRIDIAKGICKAGCEFCVVIALVSSLICFAASSLLSGLLFGGSTQTYLIELLAVDTFPVISIQFLTGIIYGLQDFKRYCILFILSTSTKIGVGIFLLFRGLEIVGILAGWIIGDCLFLTLMTQWIYSYFKKVRSVPFALKSLMNYSVPLYGSGVLNYFSLTIDRYIVLGLVGTSILGIYGAVATAAGAASIISGGLSNALFPQLSETYARSGKDALKNACNAASRYMSLISMPLAFGLAVTAVPTLSLFVGDRYVSGAPALAIIALASAVTCLSAVLNNVLLSLGETRIFFVAGVVAIAVDAFFCFLLVENLGSVGAAVARSSLIIILFMIPAFRLRSIMGLNIDFKAYLHSLIGSIVMASVVFVAELLVANKYALPLYILSGGAVYILVLRLLKTPNHSDISLLEQYLPIKMKRMRFLARILIPK